MSDEWDELDDDLLPDSVRPAPAVTVDPGMTRIYNPSAQYLGIDPGINGFLAIVDASGRPVEAFPVPRVEDDYDLPGMFRVLADRRSRITLAILEEQQAFPGHGARCAACGKPRNQQGSVATFSTGKGFGLWLMALTASGIRYERHRPQKWKKLMGLQATKGLEGNERAKEAKRIAIAKAVALYPGYDLRENARCRVPHDGKCEALLMAEYARRVHNGG